jgi:hypothetical protein
MYFAATVVFLLAGLPIIQMLEFHIRHVVGGVFRGTLVLKPLAYPVIILAMACTLSYTEAFLIAVITTISWGLLCLTRPCSRFKKAMRPPTQFKHMTFAKQEDDAGGEEDMESDESCDSNASIRPWAPPTSPRSLPVTPMKPKRVASPLNEADLKRQWDEDLQKLIDLADRSGVPE